MRGADRQTGAMFSSLSPEAMVPSDHPLRLIRPIVNAALERLSRDFDNLYAPGGRGSIAPEKLLRALLANGQCSAPPTTSSSCTAQHGEKNNLIRHTQNDRASDHSRTGLLARQRHRLVRVPAAAIAAAAGTEEGVPESKPAPGWNSLPSKQSLRRAPPFAKPSRPLARTTSCTSLPSCWSRTRTETVTFAKQSWLSEAPTS